jgi:hypothetical protein
MTTLTTVLSNIRIDLSDTDNTAYRWLDSTIQREIDRAVDRYSAVAPLSQIVQVATVAGSRLYSTPAGSWWVERVEYPIGRTPKRFHPFRERLSPAIGDPSVAPTVVAGSGGAMGAGVYKYAYSFTVPGGGETVPSPVGTVTVGASGSAAVMFPVGPYGVTGRKIYRTVAGGSQLKLLTAIPDNWTTGYVDTASDGSLGANAPVSNTTSNISQVEIGLPAGMLPQDASGWIELTYATKHTLDNSGTTIPPDELDVVYAGAEAFLVEAYVSSVNDNFEWVDGQFRDRIDDTRSIDAWQAHLAVLQERFERRLREVRERPRGAPVIRISWGARSHSRSRV